MFIVLAFLFFNSFAIKPEVMPIERAEIATAKMLALRDTLGLTERELFDIALYIETNYNPSLRAVHRYERKETTGLSRTIEYFPEDRQVYIHLKTHGIEKIGKGSAKSVTYSIKYDLMAPELVANSVIKEHAHKKNSSQYEYNAIRMLNGCPGISYTYMISSHVKRDGVQRVTSLLQKLYRKGTFSQYFKREQMVPIKTVIKLTRDVMYGLKSIHSRNLVHGDFHMSNLMVDARKDLETGKERLSGVIIDFNHTLDVEKAKLLAPRLQASRRRNPPECFLRPKEALDPKAVDVYAMGLCLYRIYFQVEPEWASDKACFQGIVEMSEEEKMQFGQILQSEIDEFLRARCEDLGQCPEFARLILQMCDPDPENRPKVDEICARLASM